jgi:hypothetical protein
MLNVLSLLQVRRADLVQLCLNRRPLLDSSIRGTLFALVAARGCRIVRVHALCPELPVEYGLVALRSVIRQQVVEESLPVLLLHVYAGPVTTIGEVIR